MGTVLFIMAMLVCLLIPLAAVAMFVAALYQIIFSRPKLFLVAAEPGLPGNIQSIRPSPVDVCLRRSQPASPGRKIISLTAVQRASYELQYPYEGKCPCRIIRLGSYGVLTDVTVRCERCGQPFVFQYPL